MCFSANVQQNLKSLSQTYGAKVDQSNIESMFQRRIKDNSIKLSKALEFNFLKPQSPFEKKIKELIDTYHLKRTEELEAELLKQKTRLNEAESKLKEKETKKNLEIQKIATRKIKWHLEKILDLGRAELRPTDERMFPMTFAPIIVSEKNERMIRLARYHCRPAGQPESIDFKFNGLYNARRDSLDGFWKNIFGQHHGFFVVSSFYENVVGENSENQVFHYHPPPGQSMLVACLFDHWGTASENDFYSFAAVTGDATPEIAGSGHDRLIIALKEKNLDVWLNPKKSEREDLYQVLDDPQPFVYKFEPASE